MAPNTTFFKNFQLAHMQHSMAELYSTCCSTGIIRGRLTKWSTDLCNWMLREFHQELHASETSASNKIWSTALCILILRNGMQLQFSLCKHKNSWYQLYQQTHICWCRTVTRIETSFLVTRLPAVTHAITVSFHTWFIFSHIITAVFLVLGQDTH
jgi:hypothetical protein